MLIGQKALLRMQLVILRMLVVYLLLKGRLVHRLCGIWVAGWRMVVVSPEVVRLMRPLNVLRHAKLLMSAEVLRHSALHGRRFAHVLEWCIGMSAMLLLHMVPILSCVGDVVEIDVSKLEQIPQIIQVARHVRHWVEFGGAVHGEAAAARLCAREVTVRLYCCEVAFTTM